jgi:hypothetical protein
MLYVGGEAAARESVVKMLVTSVKAEAKRDKKRD